jgi:DNA-binding LytR/AlgR family response regulator
MKVLIVEDERPAQQELIRLLGIIDSGIEVMTCLESVKESVAWLSSNSPELIFMDIQLGDGSSFDIFNKAEITAPVIFTTAYDEFAVRAFKVNSIDYLLKPLDESSLLHAIEKYHFRFKTGHKPGPVISTEIIENLISSMQRPAYKTRFVVTVGDKIKHVGISDIAYFRAEGNTVFLICKDSLKYIVNYTLDELNTSLDPGLYFRLNRSYLANIASIREVRKYFNSRLKIFLNPDAKEEILISRLKAAQFLEWMDQ